MTMSKHTRGPWATRPGFWDGEIEVYPLFDGPPEECEWSEIATVKDAFGEELDHGFCEFSNTEANARLISAAPDLLEAARRVLDYATLEGILADRTRHDNSVFGIRIGDLRALAAAIAKAEAAE